MDRTRAAANERASALAGAAVALTGFLSVVDGWGAILVLAVLAGLGAVGVVLAPRFAPSARLPGSPGSLLVLLGVVAVLAWIPPLIAWLDWIVANLVTRGTIQFLVGFVFAVILGRAGWTALQAEGGTLRLGAQPVAPAASSLDRATGEPGPSAAGAANEPGAGNADATPES
jgi:hypothetical protein